MSQAEEAKLCLYDSRRIFLAVSVVDDESEYLVASKVGENPS